MRRIYWRCNSGHYFSTLACPFDGWSVSGIRQLLETINQSTDRSESLSIQDLQKSGIEPDLLDRVIIIEFGAERSAFDGFSPAGYVINGKYVPLNKLSRNYF